MRTCLALSCLFLLLPATRAAEADPVFDLKALLAPPLKAKGLKTTEKDGVVLEEVQFHSHNDGTKNVDIFGYFAYPKGAKKLPAFVWNQGGLYQATTHFPELGAKRGYAVLCIDFPLPGYRSTGGYPITSGVELPDDPHQAPIYHGAVALLRAVSYLESRPEVDNDRIGMAGSSWGGFYTTLMVGVDPRLKAGTSMFGSGGLELGNNWWEAKKRGGPWVKRWQTTLDPAFRLPRTKTPIAWFTGTNDTFYHLPAVCYSFEKAAGPKHLSFLPNFDHALTPAVDDQVFAWLDEHLKGEKSFLAVSPLKQEGQSVKWTFTGPAKEKLEAKLLVSPGDAGNWVRRPWMTLPAKLTDGNCVADLPPASGPYHVIGTLVDAKGRCYSTPVLRIDPKKSDAPLAYDGCAMWGGFEEEHVGFLKLHGLPVPTLASEGHTGKASAVFKGDKVMALPPVLAVPGTAHKLSLFVKADAPTEVTVQLSVKHDGQTATEQKVVKASTEWTEAVLEVTTPKAERLDLQLALRLPPGANVRVDDVTFKPVGGH